jgi:4-hydroxy-3-methylbut-2-enyl diphosphate reductase IspH
VRQIALKALKRLEEKNIFVIDEENLPTLEKDKDNIVLVVRAHGIKKEIIEYISDKSNKEFFQKVLEDVSNSVDDYYSSY